VIAFALGALASATVLLVGGFVLGIAAQAGGWHSFRVGPGALSLLEFERSGRTTTTTFGSGLALVAAAGGALNAAAAAWLRGRRKRR
jgi:hypothetical protein